MKNINLLPVKPFQETLNKGYCGPASLKMVLDFYGVKKSEKELARLCSTDPELGTNAEGLKKAAESFGLKVEIKDNASFEDIENYLSKKIPVIVDWFTRGRADYSDSEVADGHYSVVVGLDKENIYLQDSEIGNLRTIRREDFLKVWFDFTGEYLKSWEEMIIRQIIAVYK